MTAHVVGTKGQVVVEKAIREQLGVKPGWQVMQRVVDGHVELHFLPPRHNRSLAGVLKPHLKRHLLTDEDWAEAREEAATAMALEKERPWLGRSVVD